MDSHGYTIDEKKKSGIVIIKRNRGHKKYDDHPIPIFVCTGVGRLRVSGVIDGDGGEW